MQKIKAVIFDLDGTLANTLPLCIRAFREAVSPLIQRPLTDEEIIAIIQSWMGSRDARLNTRPIYFAEVDKELNLPPGTAKNFIKAAAQKWHYEAEQEGQTLILFKERPHESGRRSRWDKIPGY